MQLEGTDLTRARVCVYEDAVVIWNRDPPDNLIADGLWFEVRTRGSFNSLKNRGEGNMIEEGGWTVRARLPISVINSKR